MGIKLLKSPLKDVGSEQCIGPSEIAVLWHKPSVSVQAS